MDMGTEMGDGTYSTRLAHGSRQSSHRSTQWTLAGDFDLQVLACTRLLALVLVEARQLAAERRYLAAASTASGGRRREAAVLAGHAVVVLSIQWSGPRRRHGNRVADIGCIAEARVAATELWGGLRRRRELHVGVAAAAVLRLLLFEGCAETVTLELGLGHASIHRVGQLRHVVREAVYFLHHGLVGRVWVQVSSVSWEMSASGSRRLTDESAGSGERLMLRLLHLCHGSRLLHLLLLVVGNRGKMLHLLVVWHGRQLLHLL